jgi:DNA-directed RNA polymerase specialized sigma24 family protein
MTERGAFREKFDALDAAMRATLVFRYREGLPLAHVAQLVDVDVERLRPRIERALAGLGCGEEALRQRLDELRDDPGLSSFALITVVRAERRRRRFRLGGLVWRRA